MSVAVEAQPVLASAANINSVNPAGKPFLQMPPFPAPPPGVTIMPFKDFKERGIAVEPGPDGAEVDTLGVPTIPIKVRHATDVCKTNTKRKRQAEEAKARKKGGAGTKNVLWYEEWEQTEAARFSTGFNPVSPRFERIQAAVTDFVNGRKWPITFASETGPKFIFDKFLRYIGIPDGGVLREGTKKKKDEEEEMSDDDDDDDDMDEEEEHETVANAQEDSMAGIIMDRDAPGKLQLSKNEEKLLAFFHNPEKSIRIFLSSYARQMGFIWADPNLDCMGRILEFFVNFLLRSKVLPESERSLRRSLEVINIAKTELPATSAIAKAFPDVFSRACAGCWGWKAEGYTVLALEDVAAPEPVETKMEEINEAKDGGWGSQSGWGAAPAEGSGWGTAVAGDSAWGASIIPESIPEADPWEPAKKDTLISLLGPTVLPLTHVTGIVEQSMRRIKSVVPLPQNPPRSPPQPEGVYEPDAAAVELELDRNFVKIVLEPMPIDWDGGEVSAYSSPKILDTSQGPAVKPSAAEGAPKAHDPLKDEITLLIEPKPEIIDLLSVGMALGGTWVQIVREGEAVKKKKKGKSKNKTVPAYWYLDTLSAVIPSFWTIKS